MNRRNIEHCKKFGSLYVPLTSPSGSFLYLLIKREKVAPHIDNKRYAYAQYINICICIFLVSIIHQSLISFSAPFCPINRVFFTIFELFFPLMHSVLIGALLISFLLIDLIVSGLQSDLFGAFTTIPCRKSLISVVWTLSFYGF